MSWSKEINPNGKPDKPLIKPSETPRPGTRADHCKQEIQTGKDAAKLDPLGRLKVDATNAGKIIDQLKKQIGQRRGDSQVPKLPEMTSGTGTSPHQEVTGDQLKDPVKLENNLWKAYNKLQKSKKDNPNPTQKQFEWYLSWAKPYNYIVEKYKDQFHGQLPKLVVDFKLRGGMQSDDKGKSRAVEESDYLGPSHDPSELTRLLEAGGHSHAQLLDMFYERMPPPPGIYREQVNTIVLDNAPTLGLESVPLSQESTSYPKSFDDRASLSQHDIGSSSTHRDPYTLHGEAPYSQLLDEDVTDFTALLQDAASVDWNEIDSEYGSPSSISSQESHLDPHDWQVTDPSDPPSKRIRTGPPQSYEWRSVPSSDGSYYPSASHHTYSEVPGSIAESQQEGEIALKRQPALPDPPETFLQKLVNSEQRIGQLLNVSADRLLLSQDLSRLPSEQRNTIIQMMDYLDPKIMQWTNWCQSQINILANDITRYQGELKAFDDQISQTRHEKDTAERKKATLENPTEPLLQFFKDSDNIKNTQANIIRLDEKLKLLEIDYYVKKPQIGDQINKSEEARLDYEKRLTTWTSIQRQHNQLRNELNADRPNIQAFDTFLQSRAKKLIYISGSGIEGSGSGIEGMARALLASHGHEQNTQEFEQIVQNSMEFAERVGITTHVDQMFIGYLQNKSGLDPQRGITILTIDPETGEVRGDAVTTGTDPYLVCRGLQDLYYGVHQEGLTGIEHTPHTQLEGDAAVKAAKAPSSRAADAAIYRARKQHAEIVKKGKNAQLGSEASNAATRSQEILAILNNNNVSKAAKLQKINYTPHTQLECDAAVKAAKASTSRAADTAIYRARKQHAEIVKKGKNAQLGSEASNAATRSQEILAILNNNNVSKAAKLQKINYTPRKG